jgi:signal transduction histidine kinase
VALTIRDDGKGFVPVADGAGRAGGRGFGLLGLSERVNMLGGEWAIESELGKGTLIHIALPRERDRNGH